MDTQIIVALLWFALSVLGLILSIRAIWRGQKRYRESEDVVGRAVHIAELSTGALFFVVFGLAICTVLISTWLLPPLDEVQVEITKTDEAYSIARRELLQWLLIGQKLLEVFIVLIPEALDNYLIALARGRGMEDPHLQGAARKQE